MVVVLEPKSVKSLKYKWSLVFCVIFDVKSFVLQKTKQILNSDLTSIFSIKRF